MRCVPIYIYILYIVTCNVSAWAKKYFSDFGPYRKYIITGGFECIYIIILLLQDKLYSDHMLFFFVFVRRKWVKRKMIDHRKIFYKTSTHTNSLWSLTYSKQSHANISPTSADRSRNINWLMYTVNDYHCIDDTQDMISLALNIYILYSFTCV